MIDNIFHNVENLHIQTHAQIKKIFDRFHNLKSKLLEYINSIQENLQLWNKEFNSKFNQLNKEDVAQAKVQYQKMEEENKNWITKISNALNKMKNCDEYQSFFNQLQGIHKEDCEIKLISTIIQQECECNAISINKSGQLIATGDAENISIWECKEGNMKRVQQITKHPQSVSCLIFSRYTNSFISACKGGRIHCWQQTAGIGNFQSKSEQFQYGPINCMILNKEDNQLFSGSEANRIIVWKVDFESYELTKMQELQAQGYVEGLALNPSEQILASTLNNKEIAIYKKQNNKKWYFHSNATKITDESGSRICFLSEKNFIWVTGGQVGIDSICFFVEDNGQYKETEKKIKLTENKKEYDFHQFDIIYQREKNIVIIKQKFQIWIMRVNYNGELEKISVIQCNSKRTVGTLTHDGSKFIYFERIDNRVGKFYIYNLELN
ncbi:unnamed protein product [Paramecium pentaurelia]|uniref:WD40-repeat-containing domain n=1 Tax=Paramecium pentaurelia TaxID=43138 RepID=A0A8S1Y7B8_9CILI|nr:unnamed protein product [Paramecium pentaurelia]